MNVISTNCNGITACDVLPCLERPIIVKDGQNNLSIDVNDQGVLLAERLAVASRIWQCCSTSLPLAVWESKFVHNAGRTESIAASTCREGIHSLGWQVRYWCTADIDQYRSLCSVSQQRAPSQGATVTVQSARHPDRACVVVTAEQTGWQAWWSLWPSQLLACLLVAKDFITCTQAQGSLNDTWSPQYCYSSQINLLAHTGISAPSAIHAAF